MSKIIKGMSKFVRNQLKYGSFEVYFEHIGKKEGIYKAYNKLGQLYEESNYINGLR